LRYLQQRDITLHIGLLTVDDNPRTVIKGDDIFLRQVSHVDVGKPTETGKDKNVPYHFKPRNLKIFLHDALYFFIRKKTPIHRFQVKVVVQERVVRHHAALLGKDDYGLEEFERLGSRI
jgi:hypothetical protein